MADHDDQISNNRRRLFKALSTAPVVMTLRPGEALATASALQCLTKTQAPVFLESAQVCSTTEDCFAYIQFPYWTIPSNGNCEEKYAATKIVQVTLTSSVQFWIFDPYASRENITGSVTNDQGTLTLPGKGNSSCAVSKTGDGWFLVLGTLIYDVQTNAAIDMDPTKWNAYPVEVPGSGIQGITQTCMVSIPSGTDSFDFVKG